MKKFYFRIRPDQVTNVHFQVSKSNISLCIFPIHTNCIGRSRLQERLLYLVSVDHTELHSNYSDPTVRQKQSKPKKTINFLSLMDIYTKCLASLKHFTCGAMPTNLGTPTTYYIENMILSVRARLTQSLGNSVVF